MKKRLRIKKVDSYTGNPLEGAQFTLYADIACTVEIAESMHYSYGYVKNLVARIFSKLEIEKRRELKKLMVKE